MHMHTKHLTGINYLHNNLHTNIALEDSANHCVPYHRGHELQAPMKSLNPKYWQMFLDRKSKKLLKFVLKAFSTTTHCNAMPLPLSMKKLSKNLSWISFQHCLWDFNLLGVVLQPTLKNKMVSTRVFSVGYKIHLQDILSLCLNF